MLINSKKILKKAFKGGYAVGQFNAANWEVAQAILNAAVSKNSPVIIGTSGGQIDYFGPENLAAILKVQAKRIKVPIVLHCDHGKNLEIILRCLKAGYTSVHFDGSLLPLKENIYFTKKVVRIAKRFKASVEGEIGKIGQKYYKKEKGRKSFLTDPKEAEFFVKKTGVDSLAISIGTVHGAYKGKIRLDIKRLKEIKNLTKIPLVLHGASKLTPKKYKILIKNGISKININTDLRLAFVKTLRKFLKENKEEYILYKIFPKPILAVQKKVEEKIEIFGSQNKI